MNDRLYRSVDDRVIAGVCAGLADRLDLDPALIRIGYAILALLTGIFPLLILYVIMVVVIPEETGWIPPGGPGGPDAGSWRDQRRLDRAARHAERAARRAERRGDPIPAIIGGLFLVGLGVFFLVRNTFDIDWAVVWPVAVIALGVVILVAAVRPRSG